MGKIVMLLIGLLLGFVVLAAAASEFGGELVTLKTIDGSGAQRSTSLWVVDEGGFAYLRAGSQGSGWYERLVAEPQIEVERNGEVVRYTAVPAADRTGPIEALMAEKYGWADSVVTLMPGRDPIAIRLEPRD